MNRTSNRLTLLGVAVAAGALAAAVPIAAQVTPTREEILRQGVQPVPPPVATIDGVDGIERAPCPLAAP